MTSNLGSDIIQELEGKSEAKLQESVLNLLRKSFRPEFLNRLDQIVVYHRLTERQVGQIAEIQLGKVRQKLDRQNIKISFSEDLKSYLAKTCFDPVYGARPLKRIIQDKILDELAFRMIENKATAGSELTADYKDNRITFKVR
ncbi:MAG: ATP-dependent chaperone protein ClpB, ATP-dependent Clp protease ATP-binding subunit ClpB [Candidatus Gottesmanbacteria bacterium GW2011_GWA2_43_14]|uniref:ATP-dependent chaperone protein ClpB, ATP-dependent Clp protease ATP-binding subunit ClpB n=1 Tax=Candidatus Gottesmanbacteria bacterium GW2011_GWA2_43_14 TaxID=1618443 RepID=A0A0G1DLI9_9BACT|nr:MAG: ATP-dependent chaperone protein ClpB, ATP-dependent Clp protease ATP-binding subunit ClpB [Candidatus Gottesmanbacteria bacterium GW2011_GWA2_43_14]